MGTKSNDHGCVEFVIVEMCIEMIVVFMYLKLNSGYQKQIAYNSQKIKYHFPKRLILVLNREKT